MAPAAAQLSGNCGVRCAARRTVVAVGQGGLSCFLVPTLRWRASRGSSRPPTAAWSRLPVPHVSGKCGRFDPLRPRRRHRARQARRRGPRHRPGRPPSAMPRQLPRRDRDGLPAVRSGVPESTRKRGRPVGREPPPLVRTEVNRPGFAAWPISVRRNLSKGRSFVVLSGTCLVEGQGAADTNRRRPVRELWHGCDK